MLNCAQLSSKSKGFLRTYKKAAGWLIVILSRSVTKVMVMAKMKMNTPGIYIMNTREKEKTKHFPSFLTHWVALLLPRAHYASTLHLGAFFDSAAISTQPM